MKFRKKPVVIEAVRVPFERRDPGWDKLIVFMRPCKNWMGGNLTGKITIGTPEGEMLAGAGDWIIRGVKGEFYPCKNEVFEATYERVDE